MIWIKYPFIHIIYVMFIAVIHLFVAVESYAQTTSFDLEYFSNIKQQEFKIADKHDGVVNIHSVLWSKGDALTSDHNEYFSDIPHDGGYNHFELRNLERAYDLDAKGDNLGFSKGDLNPVMEDVRTWLELLFINLDI